MPHNSALPEWVVLIATRSGRRRDRTDRRPCHRRGWGDTLTVAGVPHLALGIDAPEGRQTSQERRRPQPLTSTIIYGFGPAPRQMTAPP
jgi:endonuclease YncB( thermonuclease family)